MKDSHIEYFSYYGDPPISVGIDYVDYVVARTFMAGIGEWAESLSRLALPKQKWLIRKYDDEIRFAAPLILGASSIALTVPVATHYASRAFQFGQVAGWLAACAVFFIFAIIVGRLLARSYCANATYFDSLSVLAINRGDKKNKERADAELSRRPFRALTALVSFAFTFGFNVVAGIVTHLLGY